ncbi:MAG: hypothetical protein VB092_04105 [Oscillospiraceae bacterium]|nr:hypothetical protein [Oscillospiraceae bacterium]
MKKALSILLAVLLLFALAGCAETAAQDPADAPKQDSGTSADEPTKSGGEKGEITPTAPASGASAEALYERWGSSLVGYWSAAEGRFACMDMEDSHSAVFYSGVWDAGGGRGFGSVTSLAATGDAELTAAVTWPAVEAGEAADAAKELTLTVVFDYAGLEQDGKIRIKVGDGDWQQYMFAGATREEAYQTYLENEGRG